MLIQVGSIEMLLSDSVSVAARAREQGVKVRLSVYGRDVSCVPDGISEYSRIKEGMGRSRQIH